MKKKKWIWIVSIVVFLLIAGTAGFVLTKGKAKTAGKPVEQMGITVQKVKEQELIESILVTGEIVPENEQKVFLESEKGTVKEFKAAENQTIKAGDPLIVYDATKLENELNKAKRGLELLKNRGKTEQNQIADITKRINDAKKQPQTQTIAAEVGTEGGSPAAVDITQLSKEKIDMEMQYENTKSEISSAEEQIKELTAQINDMTVVSKMDGIVVKVNQNVAKTETGSTEPVVHIISNQPYKVIGTMSEFDAVKIQEGQAVIIRPKVYKNREWMGKIETVSQFPTDGASGGGEAMMVGGGGNVTMYPFKVAITDDTKELRQGFHVSLEIKAGGSEKSLVIPHPALIDEGGPKVVYILSDGKLERREVQTGAMNDEFIAITQGVERDELVVITPTPEMHDGMEVTSFDQVD
ncbi:efflux RND transporter periplasmic adaptor subunit [Neobacillus sp. Marseille-QA0830]